MAGGSAAPVANRPQEVPCGHGRVCLVYVSGSVDMGDREGDESEPRKTEHISLVEIGNAMAELCRDAAGLAPEELKRQAVRVLVGKRVTAGIGQRLEDALSAALDAGRGSILWGRTGRSRRFEDHHAHNSAERAGKGCDGRR